MTALALIVTGVIAVEHFYIMLLEMFWWTSPRGRATFGTTVEFAESTKVLAANQGLYNGFLAAGLVWGLWAGFGVRAFFISCVVVAGVYGGLTASRRIMVVQAIPAASALLVVILAR